MKVEEAYVSFEVAKLLKEKGFEIDTSKDYWKIGEDGTMYFMSSIGAYTSDINNKFAFYRPADTYPCPTQQMAMRWLREEHKMYVCIDIKCFMPHLGKIDGYSACIWYKPENNAGICCYWVYPPKQQEAWDTYEAATEAAIKYCLENLIKKN